MDNKDLMIELKSEGKGKLGNALRKGMKELLSKEKVEDMGNYMAATIALHFENLLTKETVRFLKEVAYKVQNLKKGFKEDDDLRKHIVDTVKKRIELDLRMQKILQSKVGFKQVIDSLNAYKAGIPGWTYNNEVIIFDLLPEIYLDENPKRALYFMAGFEDKNLCKVDLISLCFGLVSYDAFLGSSSYMLSNKYESIKAFDKIRDIIYLKYKGKIGEISFVEYDIYNDIEIVHRNKRFIGILDSGALIYHDLEDGYIYSKLNDKVTKIKKYYYIEEYICDNEDYILVWPKGKGHYFTPYKLHMDGTIAGVSKKVENTALWRTFMTRLLGNAISFSDYSLKDAEDILRCEEFLDIPSMTLSGVEEAIQHIKHRLGKDVNDIVRFEEILNILKQAMNGTDDMSTVLSVVLDYEIESNKDEKKYIAFPSVNIIEFFQNKANDNIEKLKKILESGSSFSRALADSYEMYVPYEGNEYVDDGETLTYKWSNYLHSTIELYDYKKISCDISVGVFKISDDAKKMRYIKQSLFEGRRLMNVIVPDCIQDYDNDYDGWVAYDSSKDKHIINFKKLPSKEVVSSVLTAFMVKNKEIVVDG